MSTETTSAFASASLASPPPAGTPAPLNLAQAGVLAAHLQDTASADTTISISAEVRPALDADLFSEAVKRAEDDLDGARVLVAERDGAWVQWVDDTLDRRVAVHDLRGRPDAEAQAQVLVQQLADVRLPLDATTPLVQTFLILVSEELSIWLLVGHHAVADGYGGMILRARTAAWYAHLAQGAPAPAPLRYRVADAWAVADRGRGPDSVAQWAEGLADLPERLTIGEREGRPGAGRHRVVHDIAADTTRDLAAGGGTRTWVHPTIAVTAAYVSRLTRERRVVLGFVVAGRSSAPEREAVTQLARVVPLVLDVDADDDLRSLTAKGRVAVSATRRYGPVTAEELRSAVPAAWRLGRVHGPTLNIIPFDTELEIPGHVLHSDAVNRGPVEDLQVAVVPRDGGIELDVLANRAAYWGDEARRHTLRLARLVELAAADPTASLLSLDPALDDEIAARETYTATTGCRLVTSAGYPALVGEAALVVGADGAPTGRMALLRPDGSAEDLGTEADVLLSGGFPVYLERVRAAAAAVPGVADIAVRPKGRRVVVEVGAPQVGDGEALRGAVRAAVSAVLPSRASVRVEVRPAEH